MKKLFAVAIVLMGLIGSAHAQSTPTLKPTWDAYDSATVSVYGITGYDVQRKAEACAGTTLSFSTLATVTGATNNSYTDTTVVPGKTYAYRVRGNAPVTTANPTGPSAFGSCVDKLVTLPALPPPNNLVIQLLTALIDALTNFKTALQAQ